MMAACARGVDGKSAGKAFKTDEEEKIDRHPSSYLRIDNLMEGEHPHLKLYSLLRALLRKIQNSVLMKFRAHVPAMGI